MIFAKIAHLLQSKQVHLGGVFLPFTNLASKTKSIENVTPFAFAAMSQDEKDIMVIDNIRKYGRDSPTLEALLSINIEGIDTVDNSVEMNEVFFF